MKSFVFALFTTLMTMIVGVPYASAATAASGSLERIADAVDAMEGLRSTTLDDSLVVVDSKTEEIVCIVTTQTDGSAALVLSGALTSSAIGLDVVDMTHLDASAIGTLTLDHGTRTWNLTHRFDAGRASDVQIANMILRFVDVAEATRKRLGGALSYGR